MKRRSLIVVLAVTLVIAALGAGFIARRHQLRRNRPNIVLIMVDTLRQDHLPFYGYPRLDAPFLTTLAGQAAFFDCMSPTSWTKPAVASILTGLHPVHHQTYGRTDVLPPSVVPLSELLRGDGYETRAYSGNGWITREFGFGRGFDVFRAIGDPATGNHPAARAVNESLFSEVSTLRPPYFLYVHYVDPHLPYRPEHRWDGSPLPASGGRGLTPEDVHMSEFVRRPPELVQHAIDLYDGAIRDTDIAVADLLAHLTRAGLMKNTVVVVTADHGEEFAEHGRMGHGQSLYEEVTRVPLLIAGPDIVAGQRAGRATLMDIAPTLAALAGVGQDRVPFDGVDLGPHLRNASTVLAPRNFLLHLDFEESLPGENVKISRGALGIVEGTWKLLVTNRPRAKDLFDLKSDHAEQNNRIVTAPDVWKRLASDAANDYNAMSRARPARVTIALQDETRRSMAALGYLSAPGASENRSIPPKIRPPDPRPEGDLGWWPVRPCVPLTDVADESQLAGGWHAVETNGRWTMNAATAVVSARPGATLVIKGNNGRPDSFVFHVAIDDGPAAEQELAPGPFEIQAAVPDGDNPVRVIRLTTSTTYAPGAHGSTDPRTLGVFINSICAE